MNNKKTILLKESELINFLATTAIDVKKYMSEQTIGCTRFCPSHDIKEVVNKDSADPILTAAQEVIRLMEVYDKAISEERFEEFVGHKPPSTLTTGPHGNIMEPLAKELWKKTDNMSGPQVEEFVEALKNNEDATQLLEYLNISPHLTKNLPKDAVYPSDAHEFVNEWKEDNVLWSITSEFPDDIIDVYKSRTKAGTLDAKHDNAELELEDQQFEQEAAEALKDAEKAKDDFYMETWLSLPFDLPNPFKEILRHLWEMSSEWTVTIQEAATWLWDNAKKVWKWFTEDGYHIVLDIISFLGFIMCGTLLPGLGCVISVVADIVNAILYIWDKEDYFMAGLQLSMAMIPGAEAVKHYFKPLGKLLNPIFKAMFKTLQSGKALTKTAIQVEMKALAKVIGDELSLLKELIPKSLLTKIKPLINQIDEFIGGMNLKAYFPFIGDVVDDVFKKAWAIAGGFLRALIWIGEAVWYDPEYTGSLIKMFGDWTGIETFVDWGEAMEDWPKYGVKVANNTYSFFGIGGIKALVQTSIADCNNTVFTWEHVKEDYIAQHNLTENNFDEKELEKAWWNGWRPNPMMSGRSGPRKMPLTSDTEAMEAVRDEYAIWVHYAAMHACTDEKFQDKWEIDKMTCAQFEVFYKELKNKTVKKLLGKTDDYAGVEIEMGAQADLFFDFQLICGEPEEPEEEEDWEVELPAPD